MLELRAGPAWVAVFAREWWHWVALKNKSGLHRGYRLWWLVGPFQFRWGRHQAPCWRCESMGIPGHDASRYGPCYQAWLQKWEHRRG